MRSAGFSPEIRDLNYFQDDYGLKPVNGVGDDDDEDEDYEEDDGEEEEDDEEDVEGSEGYEIVEGNQDELDEN